LTAAVIASKTTPEQAATDLLEYIKKFIPEPKRGLLAGNSIHADKAFLRQEPYKKVVDHLHYRLFDVSTMKEALKRWGTLDLLLGLPKKKNSHTAKDDILESIAEARYFKEAVFQKK
jgi:oligoribonuclease